jgi:GT2 family glycosyltransferase
MHRFSLVITTLNRAEALGQLLPLLAGLEADALEIIVVDNASQDDTAAVARQFPVKYIYFAGGLAQARHIGSLAASYEWISYVDDDCKPGNPQILQQIAITFEQNPQAGIVGCRIENVGFSGMQQFKGYTKFGPNALLEFEPDPKIADVFASMTITIRKDVYEKIGGFDPAFSRGCEEVDLCMKVKAAGYKLIYTHDPFYYHYQMGSHFRFNPVSNRDTMRLYSFFKFFAPAAFTSWLRFVKNEWRLFLADAAQIRRQYSEPDFHSTHLPALNRTLDRHPWLRSILRWPLILGAIVISPVLRRVMIPLIYWKARRRKTFERTHFGLNYA